MNEKRNQKQNRGVSANALIMPIVVLLSILHILIIVVIIMISRSSSSLSAIMQSSGVYTQDATSLLAGSSLLSETSSNYVLMPLTETGETNVSPLMGYANELSQPRRGDQVLARFREYGVANDVLEILEEAADSANYMLQNQIHAISLVRTMYPLPETPPLTAIPTVEMTEEELNMTDDEKMAAARALVLGSEYAQNKKSVSENVNGCVERLQAISGRRAAETGRRLGMFRTLMWIITLTIILILIGTFSALYTQILNPLARFVKQIPTNQKLDEDRGFHEVRMVASAYNDVSKRRDALDDILRSAAETDALTNLPNRYRFEQYLLESGESGYSMAVFLFDINFLKQTNDTQGHLAGDKLIRDAAECIASCFSDGEANNCFRFGGDEFAAVVKNCTPEMIDDMVERFRETEKAHNVSISVGCAYTDEIGKTNFRNLLDEADRQMYDYKRAAHMNA